MRKRVHGFSAVKSRGLIEAQALLGASVPATLFSAVKSRGLIEASWQGQSVVLPLRFSAVKSRGLIEAWIDSGMPSPASRRSPR